MKRLTLLAVLCFASSAVVVDAQVIGTYRPSLVTYYPSASSVTPVAYYKPIPAATQYAANPYSSYPVTTVGATQVFGGAPVAQTSYVNPSPYTANYPYTTVNSPVIGGNCGCAPIQTIGTTSYYPNTVTQVAYQQPVAAPIQTVAAQPTALNGKYYVGKGLLGRPKVYAQGQPIRNALRTILP